MKGQKNLFIPALILFVSCITNTKTMTKAEERGVMEVEKRLDIIKSHLDSTLVDSSLTIVEAIFLLEDLTNIESESDGNDLGKLNPTQNDYERWLKWYNKNKGKIVWDEENSKVKLKTIEK